MNEIARIRLWSGDNVYLRMALVLSPAHTIQRGTVGYITRMVNHTECLVAFNGYPGPIITPKWMLQKAENKE